MLLKQISRLFLLTQLWFVLWSRVSMWTGFFSDETELEDVL